MCAKCIYEFAAEESVPESQDLKILAPLGRGGMGVVYKARQTKLGRTVALKVLAPRMGDRSDLAERFSREARALAQLQHPHIVAVHEFGVDDDDPYLILEYVEGTSLRKVLDLHEVTPARAREIAVQICDALEYAHGRGVIHRDIKPENILIDGDGTVKVTDFGLAKLVSDDEPRITRSNDRMGTPAYMAPEQLERPHAVDARADIYSVGAVLYEMFTGQLPLGRFPAPSACANVDARLDAAILRALEKDPERRFPSIADLKRELLASTGRRRGGAWPAALAVAAIALAVVVAWRVRGGPPSGWTEVGGSASGGGISRNSGVSSFAAIEIGPDGAPIVAWQDDTSGNSEIFLRRWDGREWKELGASAAGGGISSTPGVSGAVSLALDREGHPVVAWGDKSPGRQQIFVKRWTGAEWREMDGSASGLGVSQSPGEAGVPQLTVDRDGQPWVAWAERNGGTSRIYFKRWDGRHWVEFAGSASGLGTGGTDGNSMRPRIALDRQDRPVIGWIEKVDGRAGVFVRRWDGAKWLNLDAPADRGADSYLRGLCLDAAGNPVVVWSEAQRIYLRRHDGSRWTELAGSATGEGLGSAGVEAGEPSLRLDSAGHPIAAWHEVRGENYDIHLRRWDGTQWREIKGSTGAGGVSDNPRRSRSPSLALDSRGNPWVAWHDVTSGNWEVCLRHALR
jgi:tRNA A-37 threonylcarbamoyl transferase component Bud32